MSSGDVKRRVGMFANEFKSASARLRTDHFVQRTFKKLRVKVGDSWTLKTLAFWTLTNKGRAHLALSQAQTDGPSRIPAETGDFALSPADATPNPSNAGPAPCINWPHRAPGHR